MEAATLSSKYQIVIPKAIRDRLHLNAGQRFVFVTKGDVISLVPLQEMDQLRGIAKGADTADDHFEGLPGVVFFRKSVS